MGKKGYLDGTKGVATRFSSTRQPSPEAISRGMKKHFARKQLLEDLANLLFNDDAPSKAYEGAKASLLLGDVKPMIKLLELVKLPDKQEVQMSGAVQMMPTVKIGGKDLEINIGEEPNGDGASDNT